MPKKTDQIAANERRDIYRVYASLIALISFSALVWLLNIPRDPKNAVFIGLSAERLAMALFMVWTMGLGGLWVWGTTRPIWYAKFDARWYARFTRNDGWKRWTFLALFGVLISTFYLIATTQQTFFVLAGSRDIPVLQDFNYLVAQEYALAHPYLVRLLPMQALVWAWAFTTMLVIPLLRFGREEMHRRLHNAGLLPIAGVYGVFLLAWAWLGGTRLKMTVDILGWNATGAPVTDTYVYIAVGVGLVLLLMAILFQRARPLATFGRTKPQRRWRGDAALVALIWLGAVVLWGRTPLVGSWYVTPPQEPAYAYYPNSDAKIYARTAQNLLIGEGLRTYNDLYPRRPAFAVFQAGLQTLLNDEYTRVAFAQVLLYAVLPALVYLITQIFSNRLAGLMAAILLVLREGGAIALSGSITVSHAKLIMTELPTALGIALFTLIMLRWLGGRKSPAWLPMVGGSLLGLLALIRIETGVLLLVMLLIFALWRRDWRTWALSVGLLVAGFVLFIMPWVVRNYQIGGEIFLELPGNRIDFLESRLNVGGDAPVSPTPTSEPQSHLFGPELAAVNDMWVWTAFAQEREWRVFIPLILGSRSTSAVDPYPAPALQTDAQPEATPVPFVSPVIPPDPRSRSQIVANHFIHNFVESVLFLPTGFRVFDSYAAYRQHGGWNRFVVMCCTSQNYVQRMPYWEWGSWDLTLPQGTVVPIAINLLLLSIGLWGAWKTRGWVGWLPLVFSIAYFAVNALARTSGGRYLHPVDWIWLMYYAIGLAQMIRWFLRIFIAERDTWWDARFSVGDVDLPVTQQTWGWVAGAILLVGAIIPIAEQIPAQRYTPETRAQTLATMLDAPTLSADEREQLAAIVPNLHALEGRALYPRYYAADESGPGTARTEVSAQPYARLTFQLIGNYVTGVVLPLENPPAIENPHLADVLVLGCFDPSQTYVNQIFNAAAVYVPQTETWLLPDPIPKLFCSPAETQP